MKEPADSQNEGPGNDTMKSILQQAALAAGGVLVGYAAYRLYQASQSEAHEREEKLGRWLKQRLAELENAIGMTPEQRAWLEDELDPVIKLANRACRKIEKLQPSVLDELSLEIEERFLKLKMQVRKTLKLAEDRHLKALPEFYEEFRQLFFGLTPEK